jgi:AcrR family transcriptional regulator
MRRDAEENQQEILRCAQQLFARHGVSAVSMNQIAKTLGIGAGTLYRHYPSKSALCMALVYDDLARFVTTSRSYLTSHQDSPRSQFQNVLERYLQFREQNHELLMNVDAGTDATSGSYFYSSASYQSVVAVFSTILHAILPELDDATCQFRADMLIAMLKSDAYAYQRQVRALSPQQLIAEITALFLD